MDDEEDAAERIENTVKAADEVSREFGRDPKGWHDFSPTFASRSLPIFSISPSSRFLI